MTSSWTDAKRDELLSKWTDGMSCRQLSEELGCSLGMISGKLARMGLKRSEDDARERRSKRIARKPRTRKPRAEGKPRVPRPKPVEPTGRGMSLMELTPTSCRWPNGDPGQPDFHFCGGESVEGGSYCSWHCRIAYQPRQPSRRTYIPARRTPA